MGNCQERLSQEDLEFKRKQIFKPKKNCNNEKENIPPPKLDTFSIASPNDHDQAGRKLQLQKQHKKQSDVIYHLSNSIIDLKLSALGHKQQDTKMDLPIIISKDTNHSSNERNSDKHQHTNFSVDSIIRNFQQNDLLVSNRQSIQDFGPNKQSESYIQKQQVRMKYTKSQYIEDQQHQINKA